MHNASDKPAEVEVTAVSDGKAELLDRLGGLTVPALGRRGFKLNDVLGVPVPGQPAAVLEAALIVRADRPVVVERAMYRVGRTGISTSLAVPFLD